MNANERINFLDLHKRFCGTNMSPTLFENNSETHTEYWLASDIMPLYYKSTNTSNHDTINYFINIIIPNTFDTVSQQYTFEQNIIVLPAKTNAKLSRYAIFCIINSLAPNNMCDLVYIMSPNGTQYQKIMTDTLKFRRIDLREKLKYYEQEFSHLAKHKGMDFADAQRTLQQALFGDIHPHEIKQQYNIPTNKPLSDYMGAWAISTKINTINNLLSKKHTNNFFFLLQQCAAEQRSKMLHSTGYAPENDIHQQSVKQVAAEFKKQKQEFLERCTHERLY